jgi:hypothetical protein
MSRTTLLSSLATLGLLLAMTTTVPAGEASSEHAQGSWLYPPEVVQKLNARGYSPACSGRRAYRWTRRSDPNNRQTWQYRHFECFSGVNPPTIKFICVHSAANRGIRITQVTVGNNYRPCRF